MTIGIQVVFQREIAPLQSLEVLMNLSSNITANIIDLSVKFRRFSSPNPRPYGKIYLPPQRSNENLRDDDEYIASISELVTAVEAYRPLDESVRILDFGCGQGRLAQGLIMNDKNICQYVGLDTDKWSIDWCNRWVKRDNRFSFKHMSAYNERYNRRGEKHLSPPVPNEYFDIAFLNSVFSHMNDEDIKFYLNELHSKLKSGGIIWLTAFIEHDVPAVEENPSGYLAKRSLGPLHRVRYQREYFSAMIKEAGFETVDFHHRRFERTGQSLLVAKKARRAT